MTPATTKSGDFATDLYGKLASAQAGTDLFLSPFSVQVALAMCAAGAKSQTRQVLADLIGAPVSVEEQNRQFAARLGAVQGAGTLHVQLATANALWVQQGCRLHAAYRKAVADFYDGACNELDFRTLPDQAVKAINSWVEGKTQGKIKTLISRQLITEATRLILTNAIYFKGKWQQAFDRNQTLNEDWHGAGGVRKVPMMQQKRAYLYYEGEDFQALDLPYQGEQLSMLIVLPRKIDGLAALESKWTTGPLYQHIASSLAHENNVVVSLPRFQVETAFQLRPALSAMGAALAFSADADFSGIGAEPLQIAEVVHKAFVEVNEEGTEAAAATGVVMTKSAAIASQPKRFRADHPFLFVIRDRKTRAVLFCGRVAA
jgi:serpin B